MGKEKKEHSGGQRRKGKERTRQDGKKKITKSTFLFGTKTESLIRESR